MLMNKLEKNSKKVFFLVKKPNSDSIVASINVFFSNTTFSGFRLRMNRRF